MEAEAEEPEEEAVPEVAVTEVGLSLKKKNLIPSLKMIQCCWISVVLSFVLSAVDRKEEKEEKKEG